METHRHLSGGEPEKVIAIRLRTHSGRKSASPSACEHFVRKEFPLARLEAPVYYSAILSVTISVAYLLISAKPSATTACKRACRKVTSKNALVFCAATFRAWRTVTPFLRSTRSRR